MFAGFQPQLPIDELHRVQTRPGERRGRRLLHGVQQLCRRPAQARCTALPTDDTVAEPPSSGACGRLESPRRNSTSLIGRPIASAAIWVIAV